jgi:hypothetical protein
MEKCSVFTAAFRSPELGMVSSVGRDPSGKAMPAGMRFAGFPPGEPQDPRSGKLPQGDPVTGGRRNS